jgi:hypothetical protein
VQNCVARRAQTAKPSPPKWTAYLRGADPVVAHASGRLAAGHLGRALCRLGGPWAAGPGQWLKGANCQVFAYGVLGLFGLPCPPLRSSDLWEGSAATVVVERPGTARLGLVQRH